MQKEEQEKLYSEILKKITNANPKFNTRRQARIDIINLGSKDADVEWLMVSDPKAKLEKPVWFSERGNGYTLTSDSGWIIFRIRCKGEGELEISLRGPMKTGPDGKKIYMWIDFENLQINGRYIFQSTKKIRRDKPYKTTWPVSDGDELLVLASWKEHDKD